MAQYREMAAFAQFGAELDQVTLNQIRRGERLVELLKQGQYQPISMPMQVLQIYSGITGKLDVLDKERVSAFLSGLKSFMAEKYQSVLERIEREQSLSSELRSLMDEAIDVYRRQFVPNGTA